MSPNRTHPLFNRASSQQSQASLNQSSCVNIGETIPAKPISTISTTISQRNSTTTSFIWDHGLRSDSPAGRHWNCSYCRTNLSAATTSTAMVTLKRFTELLKQANYHQIKVPLKSAINLSLKQQP